MYMDMDIDVQIYMYIYLYICMLRSNFLMFVFLCCGMQKSFSFAVRDSLVNIGPLKDFSYSLRINADPNATGIAKQSNYELVGLFFFLLIT